MNQITHFRCDSCSQEMVRDSRRLRAPKGWATVITDDIGTVDFCPACWKKILAFAKVEIIEEH
jgi:hypothetical protein